MTNARESAKGQHMVRRGFIGATVVAAAAAAVGWWRFGPSRPLDGAALAERFAQPLPPPQAPLRVYHLGHSLVGREMPVMLEQLATAALGPGHAHASQLGWGTSLKEHWGGPGRINGFEAENAHPRFRPADAALASGAYDAVVLTEMVELRDAIRWHDSAVYLARWADRALAGRPDVALYFYTTWHHLDDRAGFLNRIDADQQALWVDAVLRPALARVPGAAIRIVPGGPALAAVIRAAEARGGVPGLADRTALFRIEADGRRDTIHLSPLGLYVIALVHFAVLYQRNPVGLPVTLTEAEGAPPPDTTRLIQAAVWDAARRTPLTGLAAQAA